MLSIFGIILLWILRIIGFILALIVLILLLILFVPFRYKVEGAYDGTVDVKVKFSWLLKFVSGTIIQSNKDSKIILKILFFRLNPDKVNKKPKAKNSALKETSEKNKQQAAKTPTDTKWVQPQQTILEADEMKDEKIPRKTEDTKEPEAKEPETKEPKTKEPETKEPKAKEPEVKEPEKKASSSRVKYVKEKNQNKQNNKKKSKNEPESSIEKAKKMWEFLRKAENTGLLKHIKKYLFKIIKWILPKKMTVSMEIGFSDPSLTGYFAGVTSIAYVLTKTNIHVVPNFEQEIIKGQFSIKGRLFLFQLLYYIIRLIIDKRVRRLIKQIRS